MRKANVLQHLREPENATLKKLRQRVIREFLDIIVLSRLREGNLSGYDIIIYLNSRFQTVVSSGTVYSLLYSMERKGLIEGVWDERKRAYRVSEAGCHMLEDLKRADGAYKDLVATLMP
jgi:DNA-binding PadR family transcriptional regulator